jgi:hypothetical protein
VDRAGAVPDDRILSETIDAPADVPWYEATTWA